MRSWVKIGLLVVIGLALTAGAVWAFVVGPIVIPPDFISARTRGAELALEIGVISQNSLRSLDEIAQHDRTGNRAEALVLITRELIKNRDLHERAVALSTELATMAEQIPELRPNSARALAAEGISYEVAMVGRLLGYTSALRDLFEVLRTKLTKDVVSSSRVRDLLLQINTSASSINSLNKAFNETMGKFDQEYQR